MQHTLIPTGDRKRLHREYFVRVLIVSLFILSVSIALGSAALFPAYIRAWLSDRAAQSAVAAARGNKADDALTQANKDLTRDSLLVENLYGNIGEPQFSDAIRAIVTARGSNRINSFGFVRTDSRTFSVTISGVSPTRDDLLAFKSKLESLIPGTKIDIPIDQLAKSSNLQFSLQFSEHLP